MSSGDAEPFHMRDEKRRYVPGGRMDDDTLVTTVCPEGPLREMPPMGWPERYTRTHN